MKVTVYEVGPRDGLQALPQVVPVEQRIELINSLYDAGLKEVEEVSFVHPKLLPQMANAEEVFTGRGSALVLNKRGFDRAIAAGAEKINIVISPCEKFCIDNMGRRYQELLLSYRTFLHNYPKDKVRVYISMAFGSPTSGDFSKSHLDMVVRDAKMFGDTVVFADTIGVAANNDIEYVADLAFKHDMIPALHLHHRDREDLALSLVRTGLFSGIKEFDASIGGLGGCPFAEGSGSNLSTEVLLRHIEAWGFEHGVDMKALKRASALAFQLKSYEATSSPDSWALSTLHGEC